MLSNRCDVTDPSGFVSTVAIAGAGVTVVDENHLAINNPLSSTTYAGNYFGDYAGGAGNPGGIRIEGKVFDDANANLLDDSESGISGVTIAVSAGVGDVTDGTGTFILFAPSDVGPITIAESDPSGFVSTVAISGTGVTVIDENHLAINNPISSTTYAGNKFGDFFGVRVLGSIFSDRNVNGQWDVAYEPVITATSVTLAGSGGLTASTGSTGVYTLYVQAVGGFVSVTETVPAGYTGTTPTSLVFAGTPGQQITNKDFGLLPPSCGADAYEALADDFYNTTGVTLTVGSAQAHNFHRYDDKDWVEVNLQQDQQYTFTTVASGVRADTVLQLFASDGVTLLAGNDDFGPVDFSSQIDWTAQQSGLHYLLVTQRDATLAGCGTTYSLQMMVEPRYTLYLPLIAKDLP